MQDPNVNVSKEALHVLIASIVEPRKDILCFVWLCLVTLRLYLLGLQRIRVLQGRADILGPGIHDH